MSFIHSFIHSFNVGPILLYTPLKYSHLISNTRLNNHLYADDTQLFFSFYPPDLHSGISRAPPECFTTNLIMDIVEWRGPTFGTGN